MGNPGRRGGAPPPVDSDRPKLLVLDLSYTLETIRDRRIEASVTCRDLDGFFEHVWTVHPFATLLTSDEWSPRYGRPVTHELVPRHTFIEGKVGRFRPLRRVFALNFLIGQVGLFAQLYRLIRREGIDVIRVSSPLYDGLIGWMLARLSGIPLVIRVGGNYDKTFETTGSPLSPRMFRTRKMEKRLERFIFPRADLVAGANQDNLDFALANGARPERTTHFRYGNLIDPGHFSDPRARSIDPKLLAQLGVRVNQFLLYVGRLEPVKQPDHVVEVLARARAAGFDVKAVLAGDGRMEGQLEAQADSLGIADALVMPGSLPQDALAQLYASALVVISPHTGRALSEAALGGAPVVAYDIDWQGELIVDGETGLLVPHGDVQALAGGALDLLTDTALARRLGDRLRASALRMLDPAALNAHERSEYSKLLDARRASP
jgi:glycosyltransferase involved in cell wall biosynthesis